MQSQKKMRKPGHGGVGLNLQKVGVAEMSYEKKNSFFYKICRHMVNDAKQEQENGDFKKNRDLIIYTLL